MLILAFALLTSPSNLTQTHEEKTICTDNWPGIGYRAKSLGYVWKKSEDILSVCSECKQKKNTCLGLPQTDNKV